MSTTTDEYVEESNVELSMMYFAPSASVEDGVYYVARRGVDPIAYFGESEIYYVSGNALFRLEFPGSGQVVPIGEEPTGSVTNYILGNDPSRWRSGLTDCAVLRYVDIYPGIDLVYKFSNLNMKYEFVVAPHADPGMIRLSYADTDMLDVRDDHVTASKNGFNIKDCGLVAFQQGMGDAPVECTFRPCGDYVALCLGEYETSSYLVIDPVLIAYSTFLGGSSDEAGRAIAVEDGFAYVTGITFSSDFPNVSAYNPSRNGVADCFVTKFAVNGTTLVYSTFLGGSSAEFGRGIAVETGFVYVTGETYSSDFPTASAYDPTPNGICDCFVTKLSVDGQSLAYSTYLGGSNDDWGYAISVQSGSAFVTGTTQSSTFPTVNAYDSVYNAGGDCFVAKFSADGLYLTYSTFLGGSTTDQGYGIAAESGYAYVIGYTESFDFPTANAYDSSYNGAGDCFVTKLAADGASLVYSTFLGSSSGEQGYGIAAESGSAYLTGITASSDFPTVNAYDSSYNGAGDCFVTKLAANGLSLVYSTFLGGPDWDCGSGIAVETGFAYVTGDTCSADFPTANAYDSTHNGWYDCFVTKLGIDGLPLIYSTFIGGSSDEQAYGIGVEHGLVCVTGSTYSSDFPAVGAYDSSCNGTFDCFVTALSEDTDMDGLSDWAEAMHGTDPFCIDSDNDNFLDGYEVQYGSNATDPMSYPTIPQAWYDAIYEDLDGNATLIQYLITWSNGNSTLLQNVMEQLDDNATLLEQVISWLDGNHTTFETLFTYVDGNATLLTQTVNAVNANSDQLALLAALVTHNTEALGTLNATHIGDMAQIRAVLDMLGVTVGDTDYDGLDDLDEIARGTNIQCIDTDCDNLNDAYEVKIGTDPTDDDTDNDTYYDGAEVLAGSDPLDPLDYPGSTSTTTTTQPSMGIELIVIVGAVGCVGLVALLVIGRRRTGAKSSS